MIWRWLIKFMMIVLYISHGITFRIILYFLSSFERKHFIFILLRSVCLLVCCWKWWCFFVTISMFIIESTTYNLFLIRIMSHFFTSFSKYICLLIFFFWHLNTLIFFLTFHSIFDNHCPFNISFINIWW